MRRCYDNNDYERGFEDGRRKALDEALYEGEPLADVIERMAKKRFKHSSVKRDGKKGKYEGITISNHLVFEIEVVVENPNKECYFNFKVYEIHTLADIDDYISILQEVQAFALDCKFESKQAGYDFRTKSLGYKIEV